MTELDRGMRVARSRPRQSALNCTEWSLYSLFEFSQRLGSAHVSAYPASVRAIPLDVHRAPIIPIGSAKIVDQELLSGRHAQSPVLANLADAGSEKLL